MPDTIYIKNVDVFERFGITLDKIPLLEKKLREKHRFYHGENHISELLYLIDAYVPKSLEENLSSRERRVLKMAAYFHDSVYDPRNTGKDERTGEKITTNEERSKEFFESLCVPNNGNKDEIEDVCKIILETKTHESTTKLSKIFCDFDLYNLRYGTIERVLLDEYKIFKEFQFYDYSLYKYGRLQFLESYKTKINNDVNMNALIGFLKFRRPKIGVYAGSFNPIHIGHINVVHKAEKLFDKVIIAKGYNSEKSKDYKNICETPEADKMKLKAVFPFNQVEVYEGLTTDFLKSKSIDADMYLIRGLRDGKDLDYEVNSLRVMEDMSKEINVVFLHCDKKFEHISSSMIRALEKTKPGLARELNYLPVIEK